MRNGILTRQRERATIEENNETHQRHPPRRVSVKKTGEFFDTGS